MRGLTLFDDGGGSFGPLTDLRASFDLRTGPLTTAARLQRQAQLPILAVCVPDAITELQRECGESPVNGAPEGAGPFLLLNGRLDALGGPPPDLGTAEIDAKTGAILRATLDAPTATEWIAGGVDAAAIPDGVAQVKRSDLRLLEYPWEILDAAAANVQTDLELIADDTFVSAPGDITTIGEGDIRIAADAEIDPGTVLDARNGPILIGREARIGANAVIVGPTCVGDGGIVGPHTHLKAGTVTGPRCRLGGEIGGTVFQGYANKSHHGHLGDSWVGEWANLGAGTVNSNLLNTYGEVPIRLDADGPNIRSGRTFLGCLIGDHVKTAIGTRIMTGTVLGTGSMIACSEPPPSCTRRFSWLSDKGERRYRFDKFMDVATLVMSRRDRTPGEAYIARLATLHEA